MSLPELLPLIHAFSKENTNDEELEVTYQEWKQLLQEADHLTTFYEGTPSTWEPGAFLGLVYGVKIVGTKKAPIKGAESQ